MVGVMVQLVGYMSIRYAWYPIYNSWVLPNTNPSETCEGIIALRVTLRHVVSHSRNNLGLVMTRDHGWLGKLQSNRPLATLSSTLYMKLTLRVQSNISLLHCHTVLQIRNFDPFLLYFPGLSPWHPVFMHCWYLTQHCGLDASYYYH